MSIHPVSRRLTAALLAVGLAAGSVVASVRLGALGSASATATTTITPTLLVTNSSSNTISSFPLTATGDTSPTVTLTTSGSSDLGSAVIDASGNLWVPHGASNTIVEYTAAQIAGGGSPAPAVIISSVVTGGTASLDVPFQLAFDAAGDLWVLDQGNSSVVEYTPSQLALGGALAPKVTIAAEGTGSSASLATPYSLSFDASGDLWVANPSLNDLVEYTPAQLATTGSPTPAVTISAARVGGAAILNVPESYNQNLWMLDRCEGATYLPH